MMVLAAHQGQLLRWGTSLMRRITILSTAGALAVTVGVMSFMLGREFTIRKPGPEP